MPRARNPAREQAREMWEKSRKTAKLKDIASALGLPDNAVRKWKCEDKWGSERSDTPKGSAPAPSPTVTITEDDLRDIIDRAVVAGFTATQRITKDAYSATERRLWAYRAICQKLQDDHVRIAELEAYIADHGQPEREIQISRTGITLREAEALQVIIEDLRAGVFACQREIDAVTKAMSIVESDPYFPCVKWRYETWMTNEQIAEKLGCDVTTVCRHRRILTRRMAVYLYGAQAIGEE